MGVCAFCKKNIPDGQEHKIWHRLVVCDRCNHVYVHKCCVCGHKFTVRNLTPVHGGKWVCDDCIEANTALCCDCGQVTIKSAMQISPNGKLYCPACWRELRAHPILSYHEYDRSKYKKLGDSHNNSLPYMGVELEVDGGSNCQETARTIKEILGVEFVHMEHDGSLDNGFEIITQPSTIEYHMSKQEDYKKAFKRLVRNGFRSHQTTTCGLHVHFNRSFFGANDSPESDLYITRLLYLVEKFWPQLVKFSRRSNSALTRWAGKYDSQPETVVQRMKEHNLSRYYAVNLTNSNTIEFRLFRGTMNLETYYASLELCNRLIILAKTIPNAEAIQNLTWDEVLDSDLLKTYWERVKDRGNRGSR